MVQHISAAFDDPLPTPEEELANRHPHNGKCTPYLPGNPHVTLDENALAILDVGKPYQTQIQAGSSGRGLVVQDINSSTNIIWEKILDYNNYATMVPKTIESENYGQSVDHCIDRDSGGDCESGDKKEHDPIDLRQTIYTRMKVGISFVKLQFYIKHEYYPKHNSLTWTLDYNLKSDIDDSCGYWYVVPHPTEPKSKSRVYYSVDVRMMDWVPTFVVNFMSKQALTEATGWVKKFSELEYQKRPKQKVLPPSPITTIQEEEDIDENDDNVLTGLTESSSSLEEDSLSLSSTSTSAKRGKKKQQSQRAKSKSPKKRRRFLWFDFGSPKNSDADTDDKNTVLKQPKKTLKDEDEDDNETVISSSSSSDDETVDSTDDDDDDSSIASSESTRSSSSSSGSSSSYRDNSEIGREEKVTTTIGSFSKSPIQTTSDDIKIPQEIGVSRYLLLASVFGLSMYNIHLYFSQQ